MGAIAEGRGTCLFAGAQPCLFSFLRLKDQRRRCFINSM